jgi:transcriptional regulator with XRE-family HTH domain
MIREEIKKELDRRGWSALKLANETGIRYPSISEYLANKKELNSQNIDKILITLNLKIMGSMIPTYKKLLKEFDGTELLLENEVTKDYFAYEIFGILTRTASEYLQKEMKGYALNYGDIYDNFVAKKQVNGKMLLDISLSLQKCEFIRIATNYFNEKQKNTVAMLLLYQPESDDREYIETQFLVGLMSNMELS